MLSASRLEACISWIRHTASATAHHSIMNIETAAPESASAGVPFRPEKGWWLFCLLIFGIKFLFLWVDPLAQTVYGRLGKLHLDGADGLDAT